MALQKILLLFACGVLSWDSVISNAHSQERVRIGISTASLGFLPTIIAERKGFYAKHGLSTEHVQIACAIATNALLSDDLDYAVCTGPGISGAIKGLPIKLIMTTQDKLGYLLLVKSNVQKLPDLRGKTIGISSFGSQAYLTTVTLFRGAGMEPGKDVNLLPAGDNAARLQAMDAGKMIHPRAPGRIGDHRFQVAAYGSGHHARCLRELPAVLQRRRKFERSGFARLDSV